MKSDYSKIVKVSSDIYRTLDKAAALDHCKKISKLERDLFSVVKSYSETLNSQCYFIERGSPLIRSGEDLLLQCENGEEIK